MEIPAYRCQKEGLNKELELFKKLGVKFVFNTRVGKNYLSKSAKQNDAGIPCNRSSKRNRS